MLNGTTSAKYRGRMERWWIYSSRGFVDPMPSWYFSIARHLAALFDFYRLIGRRIDSPISKHPPISRASAGRKFRRWESRFSRFDFIFLSSCRLLHIRYVIPYVRLDGREWKGRERKEKRKLVAGAYNRGDLIQDRGDLINIEEILRGLGSDYSFEEIFRGETIGRAPTFPLKGRKSEVEKETLRGRREEERSGRRRMEEGIAISYFHLEDSLNMHETIAYLMQLAEANLFPSFPFQLAPVFFSPTCSFPPILLLLVSFASPYPRGAEGNLTLISEHLQFSRTVVPAIPGCKLNRANSHFSIDKLFYLTHPFSHLPCFSPCVHATIRFSIFFSSPFLSLYI